jgi:Zinc-binding dehydrogenase
MPVMQLPSGVHFSFFGSFMFGAPAFSTSEIPMQTIVERVEDGTYKAKPARAFRFEEIREAHRLMEAGAANGRVPVRGLRPASRPRSWCRMQPGLGDGADPALASEGRPGVHRRKAIAVEAAFVGRHLRC